jgi:hypothetical protein
MSSRLWSLSSSAALSAFAVVCALGIHDTAFPVHAQSPRGDWYSLQSVTPSPQRQQIEQLVTEALGRTGGGLRRDAVALASAAESLASRAPSDLIFIAGRASDIVDLVRNDRFQIVDRLKLEVVNARLGASLFYLFTNGEKAGRLRQPAVAARVLYASRAGQLLPNDVQALVAKAVGGQPNVAQPLNSPDELARRLFLDERSGGVDLVGIYDDDLSPFLHEFLRAYGVERTAARGAGPAAGSDDRRLLQMVVFPSGTTGPERDRLQTDRLQAIQGNLTFAYVRFDDVSLERLNEVAPAVKDGVLAVATTRADAAGDSLWVLSNVRSVGGDVPYHRLRALLADAYFVSLMASDDFTKRCEGSPGRYASYLVDAQLAAPKDLSKALAYWSDLVMRSTTGRPVDNARIADQRVLFELALRQRLNVELQTQDGWSSVATQLSGPKGTVRQQFSDANADLFDRAVADVQAALRSTDRGQRSQQLAAGRAKLLALVEKGKESSPACRGKGTGLFGRGLDPFFYLGLVDAYAALDRASGAASPTPAPSPR